MSLEWRPHVPWIHSRCLKRGATLAVTIKDDARVEVVYGEGGG